MARVGIAPQADMNTKVIGLKANSLATLKFNTKMVTFTQGKLKTH